MAAIPGVSAAFAIGAATATQVAAKNTARLYILICNLDPANTVYVAFGTGNAATSLNGIPIAPGGSYEKEAKFYFRTGDKVECGVPDGDVSVIAQNGTTVNISYYEK